MHWISIALGVVAVLAIIAAVMNPNARVKPRRPLSNDSSESSQDWNGWHNWNDPSSGAT
jgi:hypothetical protein